MEKDVDEAVGVVSELNQRAWTLLKEAVDDLSDDDIDWRPLLHNPR